MKLSLLIEEYTISPAPDGTPNAYVIRTKFGYIEYVHKDEWGDSVNEVWWVESKKKGHGSELVDLMQKNHPAEAIAWGVTSQSGKALADKWHRNNPEIDRIEGPHEGQFNPF